VKGELGKKRDVGTSNAYASTIVGYLIPFMQRYSDVGVKVEERGSRKRSITLRHVAVTARKCRNCNSTGAGGEVRDPVGVGGRTPY